MNDCTFGVKTQPPAAGGGGGGGSYNVGDVFMHAGASAPADSVLCDGQALASATEPALFAVIGTTYGGDATNFNVPDLRSRAPVHVGTGTGLSAYALGDQTGAETVALVEANLAAHTHTFTGAESSKIQGAIAGDGATGNNPTGAYIQGGEDIWSTAPATPVDTAMSVTSAGSNASTGSGTGHANIQPVLAVNFCIYTG